MLCPYCNNPLKFAHVAVQATIEVRVHKDHLETVQMVAHLVDWKNNEVTCTICHASVADFLKEMGVI